MIEIKMPKEIKEYKEKVFFGLSIKQFISLVLALAIGVPLYVFGKNIMPEEIVSWILILICAPVLCIGFVNYHGMSFVQLAQHLLAMQFKPQRRKYIELPIFYFARKEYLKMQILSEAEKKKK